jgi:hypothetical protein
MADEQQAPVTSTHDRESCDDVTRNSIAEKLGGFLAVVGGVAAAGGTAYGLSMLQGGAMPPQLALLQGIGGAPTGGGGLPGYSRTITIAGAGVAGYGLVSTLIALKDHGSFVVGGLAAAGVGLASALVPLDTMGPPPAMIAFGVAAGAVYLLSRRRGTDEDCTSVDACADACETRFAGNKTELWACYRQCDPQDRCSLIDESLSGGRGVGWIRV